MASSQTQQEITVGITIKNTFLDFNDDDEKLSGNSVRRSSSVPRTFKPVVADKSGDSSPYSDDSTNASDKDITENSPTTTSDSEQEYPDCHSDHSGDNWFDFGQQRVDNWSDCSCAGPGDDGIYDTPKSRVKLSLCDLTEGTQKARLKLSTSAQPFKSARTPPPETMTMIAHAKEVLASGPDIVDVQVHNGGMGGTTMLVAKSVSDNPDVQWTFAAVKDALLKSAENSENSYILGYGAQPFNNLDPLSFSAKIGCVPAAHQNSACWDTYEKGFCPRCSTCRWDHPTEIDMMRIIVMVKKGGEGCLSDMVRLRQPQFQ